MKPIEALFRAIERGFLLPAARVPGAVIAKLPKAEREAVQELRSDDVRNLRDDVCAPKRR